jgi:hypothetical protein
MAKRRDTSVGATDVTGEHHALLHLHAVAGQFSLDPGLVPGFRPRTTGESLVAVADAAEEDIPVSARVAALVELARAGFPGYEDHEQAYRHLAESVASRRGLQADQLLTDAKRAGSGEAPFRSTDSGVVLPAEETAFVGEQVCSTLRVDVNGLDATWVYSEFDTDAPFESVADWVDPRSWPKRGPMLFKGMSLVGSNEPITLGGLGSDHWHGVFHEEVQLVRRLHTLLHCDVWRDGDVATGMTYELTLSMDREIQVDRGFLLVNELGTGMRRVQALKMVGFTEGLWNDVAELVCPAWTDWVRHAVEGGSVGVTRPPSHTPGGAGSGDAATAWRRSLDAWVDFLGDSAGRYLDLFAGATRRAVAPGATPADWAADGVVVWSQLAQDWAQAWSHGLRTLDGVARDGLAADFGPPPPQPGADQSRRAARSDQPSAAPALTTTEGVLIPVTGLGPQEQPTVGDLVSLEAGGARLRPRDVRVRRLRLPDGREAVQLHPADPQVPAGLYVGELRGDDGRVLTPVQLYVSRAVRRPEPGRSTAGRAGQAGA